MIRGSLLEKGVAEAVGAAVASAIISLAMLYILLDTFSTAANLQPAAPIPGRHLSEKLLLYPAEANLGIKNIGPETVHISYVATLDTGGSKVIVNTKQSTLCSVSPSRAVAPGSTAVISCRAGYRPIAVVTEGGRVFSIDPQLYASIMERIGWIPITTIFGGMNITTTSELLKYIENPSLMISGAVDTSTELRLSRHGSGSVRATLDASLIFIGTNPVNNKMNLLIVGRGTPGTNVSIGGGVVDIGRAGQRRYRLKIENFTGTITIDNVVAQPGIHPCYINRGSTCRIRLSGQADRVLLYTNTTYSGRAVVGLEPYVLIGDINRNNNTEILFATQDFSTGNRNSKNDVVPGVTPSIDLLDSSAAPIRIIFSGTSIDSSRYSTAILTVRMFFWDNSEDDISDNDNRIVMRVGLYDNTTKSFVYSTYLSYHELSRYRHVRPFSTSYITKDFTMHIPNTGRRYYIAIELLDPFYLESNRNDADLIVGLEYVGIVLGSR
ncbi:MAG: hypothetical protein N3D82_03475 [Ignisphaera sp.]|nr:hypothetical protein [Ignisphaera sp.]MCX8168069.1 hypothetical protein [Ignisphaera sp.]MDW8085742.1 hypothetical protein [Ignisphaera sp.]